jgi:hypothetical protein
LGEAFAGGMPRDQLSSKVIQHLILIDSV